MNRVHKAVGYAVKGFIPTENFLTRYHDCEASFKDFVLWNCDDANKARVLDFAKSDASWARSLLLELDTESLSKKKFVEDPLSRSVVYEDECGFDDLILFIPPINMGTWLRCDSTLDYAEETHFYECRNRYQPLDRELYPYRKSAPPLHVAAQLVYFGLEELWPILHEALYVWWG